METRTSLSGETEYYFHGKKITNHIVETELPQIRIEIEEERVAA